MKITAFTKMSKEGWNALAFEVEGFTGALPKPEDFNCEGNFRGFRSKVQSDGVTAVTLNDGVLHLDVDPFAWFGRFTITGAGLTIDKAGIDELKTEMYEGFEAHREKDVIYQLYTPKAYGPRPLILYLHGGGECGDDNCTQMMYNGAPYLAEEYPDMYVMAPQAPRGAFNPMAMPASQAAKMMNRPFAESDTKGEQGWHRQYLAKICDIIREMIAEGKVLASRVYVLGASMGGGGTIRAMSVGADLFAAAAPVCPTMTPETFNILSSLYHAKVWVSTAYVDHTIYRHKYIADAIMNLQQAGNKDAHMTLYSPEELAKYGIGTDPETPYKELFEQNHGTWNLTVKNEYGILSWLFSQVKD